MTKKLSEDEMEYIGTMTSNTNKAVMWISKGRCWITANEKGVKLDGDKHGLKLLGDFVKSKTSGTKMKNEMEALFDYFGWEYKSSIVDGAEQLSGEGVMAYAIYEWLMSVNDNELDDMARGLLQEIKIIERNGKNRN